MGKTPYDQRKSGERGQRIADLVTALTRRRDYARAQLALGSERMDAEEQHQTQDHHQQSHDVLRWPGRLRTSRNILRAETAMR